MLPKTSKASGYTGTTIVDTENEPATRLREQGLIDVFISLKSGYSKGMAQPAILVLRKDDTVLDKWAIIPGYVRDYMHPPEEIMKSVPGVDESWRSEGSTGFESGLGERTGQDGGEGGGSLVLRSHFTSFGAVMREHFFPRAREA